MPHHNVAIFWDYENCHGPSSVSGYDIVKSIRCMAHTFGIVKLFKAYFELSEQSTTPRSFSLRSELQSSGVSLTDCPHNGRKNVADQMIIVDMLAYAVDTPAPATIILISGDRDFAYAVSVLRLRQYRVVIISLSVPGAHPSLRAQASIYLDWNSHIMGRIETGQKSDLPNGCVRHSPTTSISNKADINLDTLLAPSSPSQPKPNTEPIIINDFVHIPRTPQPGQDLSAVKSSEVDQTALCTSDNHRLFENPYLQKPDRVEGMRIPQEMSTGVSSRCLPVLGKFPNGTVQSHSIQEAAQEVTYPRTPPYQEYLRTPREASFASDPISGISNDHIAMSTFSVSNDQGVRAAIAPASITSLTPQQGTAATPSRTISIIADFQVPRTPLNGKVFLGKTPPLNTFQEPNSMTISSEPTQSAPTSALQFSHCSSQSSAEAALPGSTPVIQYKGMEGVGNPAPSQRNSPFSGSTVATSSRADTATALHTSVKRFEGAATDHPVKDVKPEVTSSGPKAVPSQYKLLVSKLQMHHSQGTARPLRSIVGLELVAADKSIYQCAGTNGFAQYTALALKAGIIELGGSGGTAWIALHPDWRGSVV